MTPMTTTMIMMMTSKMKKGPCLGIVLVATLSIFFLTSMWQSYGDAGQPTEADVSVALRKIEDYDYNFPHPPETIYEGLPFRYFDGSAMYQTEGTPTRSLTKLEEVMLTKAKDSALGYMKNLKSEAVFISGRYRWLPDGVEYDLLYKDSSTFVTDRVTLFQKLEAPKVIRSIDVGDNTVVKIVVSLKGRIDKYGIFLDHLVKKVLPEDPNLALTVVYFSDSNMSEAKELTRNKLSVVPEFRWSFIPLEDENFSRGRGLDLGAKPRTPETVSDVRNGASKSKNELLFFCDVDVLMQPDFFNRCRSNTVQGHQVYYPVVFSLYNPRLVYPLLDQNAPSISDQLTISEESGFWRVFGFGMACMYRSDYEASGGFPDIKTWGGEDEALYEKFLQMEHIKVLRSPDPSLFHLYHRKECTDVTSTSYPACLKSKALTEGSQLQLGLALLKLHEGTDLEGVLSKRFYYFWLVPYLAVLLVLSLLINILQASSNILRGRGRAFRDM